MNTLSKIHTARFFSIADDYTALKAHWSKLVNSDRKKDLRAEHHLLYAALLGRDWRKGFTAITNKNKLDNGMRPRLGMEKALGAIYGPLRSAIPKFLDELIAPFDGLVSREMVVEVDKLLPNRHTLYKPFEAFTLAVEANAA